MSRPDGTFHPFKGCPHGVRRRSVIAGFLLQIVRDNVWVSIDVARDIGARNARQLKLIHSLMIRVARILFILSNPGLKPGAN
jgi:hypothetical protein